MSFALPEALFFTGIDWAAETHAVCVRTPGARSRPSSPSSTPRTGSRCWSAAWPATASRRHAGRHQRPDGRLVDLLLEAGHPVVPVSPNAIKTWRDGEVLSGAKSDAGDAAVIAEYLRLRAHRLKTAAPYSDETLALRAAVRPRRPRRDAGRGHESAVGPARRALARRQGGLRRRRVADQPGVPDPLPDPGRSRAPGREADGGLLVKHGYSGRPAAELLARLRAAPAGTGRESLTEAFRDAVLAAVGVLRP